MFSKPPQPQQEAEAVDNPYGHLSVTIIAHTSERGRCVADLLPTLPKGVEICIVFNEQGEEESFELLKDETLADGTTLKFAEWRWKEFRFDHARNLALGLAARPWVLWIDADDVLVEKEPGALRKLCTGWGAHIFVNSPVGNDMLPAAQWRLFPNNKGIHFIGRVHETPMMLGATPAIAGDVAILHMGYVNASDQVMTAKARRN